MLNNYIAVAEGWMKHWELQAKACGAVLVDLQFLVGAAVQDDADLVTVDGGGEVGVSFPVIEHTSFLVFSLFHIHLADPYLAIGIILPEHVEAIAVYDDLGILVYAEIIEKDHFLTGVANGGLFHCPGLAVHLESDEAYG